VRRDTARKRLETLACLPFLIDFSFLYQRALPRSGPGRAVQDWNQRIVSRPTEPVNVTPDRSHHAAGDLGDAVNGATISYLDSCYP
jgi:hypothetical protein